MKIRLHQFLSKSGVFQSKAKVKQAIWDGDITVDGRVTKNISFEFNPRSKEVMYKGNILSLPHEESYYLLNKPTGYICSRLNSQERELGKVSVYNLFKHSVNSKVYEALSTVGRLDEDTSGFLIVTTDGKLLHQITNPQNHIKKRYLVETIDSITEGQCLAISHGVDITVKDHGKTERYTSRPAEIILQERNVAELIIDEGKKREIRRIFLALGNKVVKLHRLSTENMILADYDLKPGQFCKITLEEINRLILY